jgi:MFS superfamily sulfate permease-like transporter
VRVGYLANPIFVGPLPKLFGYSVEGGNVMADIRDLLTNLDLTKRWALGVGLLTLIIILAFKHCMPRAPSILFAVIAAITATELRSRSREIRSPPRRNWYLRGSIPYVYVNNQRQITSALLGE